MTANDVVAIADAVSALGMVVTALLIAKSMDITSATLSASRDGADDGQRTSGRRRKGRVNETAMEKGDSNTD